ncbi:AMP-binding protein, partial [Sphaerisporangium sp. B11E5]|uniref:AMP-binding protein n=1 Tax=Sphaerisporangium sp. B11E5 TaxID=3153563 RepID=UPI00325CD2B1
QLLTQTRTTNINAYTHQDLPFDHLVEALNPNRSLARHPLFQVMLVLQNAATADYPGVDVQDKEIYNPISRFDMVIEVNERFGDDGAERGLEGFVQYAGDLFDRATMEFFVAAWQRLLTAAAADPSLPVDRLPVLGDADLHDLLVARNATAGPAAETTVVEAISARARSRPDAVALVTGEGEVGYAELERRSGAVALLLEDQGVRPGDVVAVCVSSRSALAETLLGVLKAGAACLPLSDAGPAGVAAVLEDARPALVVCDAGTHDALPAGVPRLLLTEEVMRGTGTRQGDGRGPALLDAAFVTYPTEGWLPLRGTVITHRGLANRAGSLAEDRTAEPVLHLPGRPVTIDDHAALLATFARGGRVLLVDGHPEAGVRAVSDHGHPETSGACVAARHPGERPAGPGTLTAGRPRRDTQVFVLDDALRPVPYGVTGELYVAGHGLGLGYHRRPAETAERFVACPFGPCGARMFRTGDLARWTREGDLHVVGRVEDRTTISGVRVNPAEVAAALEACDLVSQAFVTARHAREGEDEQDRLTAYVVPAGTSAGPEAIRRQASEVLPELLVPRSVVLLDTLPRTAAGVVDRDALPAAPAGGRAGGGRAPAGEREKILCDLFAEVLGVPTVNADDNFFDLGGHSLMAVRLLNLVRGTMGVELDLRDMMRNPTVAGVAEALDGAMPTTRPALRRMR